MAQATAKFTHLKFRQIWGSKFPDKEKLIAMIADLKGKLKLTPNLEKKKRRKCLRTRLMRSPQGRRQEEVKNMKDTSNEKNQKKKWEESTSKGQQSQGESCQEEDLPMV
jgi:hypothetical protein